MTRGDIVEYHNTVQPPYPLGIVYSDGGSWKESNDRWINVRWLTAPPPHLIDNGHVTPVLCESVEVVGHIDE
jgi:hypothetical protein